MTAFFETLAVAFGMFSAIPVPQPVWSRKNMRFAFLAFPLIGSVIGLLWWGWYALTGRIAVPNLLRAVGYFVVPVLVTGGIHLDGYADTADALASHAGPERRQEILKDPHVGAFAVIRLTLWMLSYAALCGTVQWSGRLLLCAGLSFMLSRTLSGFAVTCFPLAKNTGLAHTFAEAADRKTVGIVLAVYAVLLTAGMAVVGKWAGGAMAAAAFITLAVYARTAKTGFGGISGDLAGWFLQKCEWWMLAALAAVQLAEGIV